MKKLNIVVKKKFLDRYTGQIRKPGDKLTVSDDRFREINRSGIYAEIDKAATDPKAEPKADEPKK